MKGEWLRIRQIQILNLSSDTFLVLLEVHHLMLVQAGDQTFMLDMTSQNRLDVALVDSVRWFWRWPIAIGTRVIG